jgi:PilZ domain
VQLERHRASRYPFQANVELTDVQSETQITGRTTDLSLFGCHVNTLEPLAPGAKVRLKIVHRGCNFQALGKVVYARLDAGMGIVFTGIESNDQLVLDNWIAELRS